MCSCKTELAWWLCLFTKVVVRSSCGLIRWRMCLLTKVVRFGGVVWLGEELMCLFTKVVRGVPLCVLESWLGSLGSTEKLFWFVQCLLLFFLSFVRSCIVFIGPASDLVSVSIVLWCLSVASHVFNVRCTGCVLHLARYHVPWTCLPWLLLYSYYCYYYYCFHAACSTGL